MAYDMATPIMSLTLIVEACGNRLFVLTSVLQYLYRLHSSAVQHLQSSWQS